jgi:L-gulonate 5-dehydrogenase
MNLQNQARLFYSENYLYRIIEKNGSMKAAVLYAPGDLRMEETPIPAPGDGDVLIKVKAVGICGSDIHFFHGTHPYKNYPRIHGHEISGIVEDTFSVNTTLKKGDPVVIEPLLSCGRCYPCRVGKYNCCASLQVIGAHVNGGFAEFVMAPSNRVHKFNETIGFDIAATAEPYSIGAQIVRRGEITSADTVLILGSGAIGLAVLDFVKLSGAKAIVAEIHKFRSDLAESFGADLVVNPLTQDLKEIVMLQTDNEGAPVVIEASGVTSVMESTENLVAAGGRIVIAGLTNDHVSFTGLNFTKREMTIYGSRNSANIFPYVIKCLENKSLHADKLITKRFDFSDIKKAFEYTSSNLDKVGKVIIEF